MIKKPLRLLSSLMAVVMGATALATPASAAARLSSNAQALSQPAPVELNLDNTINNQAFMTDALTAMQKKVESSRNATRQLRDGQEKMAQEDKQTLRSLRDDHQTLEDSTTGAVLEAGVTYYVDHDVTITNDPGKSAIILPNEGVVFIEVDKGCTLTATGGAATDDVGGGAGIQVPRNATLVLQGAGKVVATGGDASNGANGGDGERPAVDVDTDTHDLTKLAFYYGGNGGEGGKGGNGAGSGIGGAGGIGGEGGAAGIFPTDPDGDTSNGHPCAVVYKSKNVEDLSKYSNLNGTNGGDGAKGSFAPDDGSACGAIYVLDSVHVTAQGGASAGDGDSGDLADKPDEWFTYVMCSWEMGYGFNEMIYCCAGYGGAGAGGQGGLGGKAVGGGAAGGSGGGGGGSGATRQFAKNDVDSWFDKDKPHYYLGNGGWGELGKSGESGNPLPKYEDQAEPYNYDIVAGNGGGSSLTTDVFGDCAGIYRDFSAYIDGVDKSDITLGMFNVSPDGTIVPKVVNYIPSDDIPSLDGFVPENGGHYYIVEDITVNADAGKSAFALPENIFCTLDICDGVTVNLRGGDATDTLGAGAGIEVPETSSLIITGYGTLNATGGSGTSYGGAAAGIGGRGGDNDKDGQSCGSVYFPGQVKVTATAGSGSDSGACDYGIGGGAPGGTNTHRNGTNGEVYYDHDCGFKDGGISGRSRFYHDVRLALIDSSIHVQGYADLVLGNEYYGDTITLENLHNALLEANNRGSLSENPDTGYQIVDYGDIHGQKENCHGSYRGYGNQWDKHFVDYSGGYLYLLSVVYGKFIQQNMGSESTPFDFHNWVLDQFEQNGLWMNDDMKNILKTLFFFEHYGEALGDHFRDNEAYRKGNPTIGCYNSKDAALQCIQYTYVTVLDATSARYCTWMYDTERDHGDWDYGGGGYHYYYQLLNDTFAVVDGYKGVNSNNWMNFLPDDAPLAQINLPGSHDAGTHYTRMGRELYTMALTEHWIKLFKKASNETGIPEFVWYFVVTAGVLYMPLLLTLVSTAELFIDTAGMALATDFIHQMSICQDLTIPQQLEAGIRHLDIRYAYDSYGGGNRDPLKNLKVVHGTVANDLKFLADVVPDDHDVILAECMNMDTGDLLYVRDVFDYAQAFLNEDASKNECVIIELQVEGAIDKMDPNSGLSVNKQAMLDYIDQAGDNIIRYKKGDVLPDMKDAKGKIIVILSEDLNTYDKHDAGEWDNPYADKEKALELCFQEALNEYQDYTKKEPINGDEYNPKCLQSSCYDSSDGPLEMFLQLGWGINGSPRKMSEEINRWFNNQTFSRGQRYGWMLFNFPTDTTCANWYYTNVYDIDKLIHASGDTEEPVRPVPSPAPEEDSDTPAAPPRTGVTSPKTGDSSTVVAALALLSLLTLGGARLWKKRRS